MFVLRFVWLLFHGLGCLFLFSSWGLWLENRITTLKFAWPRDFLLTTLKYTYLCHIGHFSVFFACLVHYIMAILMAAPSFQHGSRREVGGAAPLILSSLPSGKDFRETWRKALPSLGNSRWLQTWRAGHAYLPKYSWLLTHAFCLFALYNY